MSVASTATAMIRSPIQTRPELRSQPLAGHLLAIDLPSTPFPLRASVQLPPPQEGLGSILARLEQRKQVPMEPPSGTQSARSERPHPTSNLMPCASGRLSE